MLLKLIIFVSFLQLAIGDELTDLANSTKNALKLYNQNNDNSIPWKNLTKFVEIVGNDLADYSTDARGFVINIRDSTRRGLDIYFEQTRKVYGWAVGAELSFRGYLQVNELVKFDNTTIILNILGRGVDVLTEAIDKMDDIAGHFSDASKHVERLEVQLQTDKKDNSTYLKEKIQDNRKKSALVGGGVTAFLALIAAFAGTRGNDAGTSTSTLFASAAVGGAGGAGAGLLVNEFLIKDLQKTLENIERIYSNFKNDTNQVFASIQSTKQKLREELTKMEAFKSKVESGRSQFINLPFVKEVHGPIISSLADECADYIKRHSS